MCSVQPKPTLDFWKTSVWNINFCLFQTWILQATAGRKIQFKLGKNPFHQTRYFKLENCKNKVQIDRRIEWHNSVCGGGRKKFNFRLESFWHHSDKKGWWLSTFAATNWMKYFLMEHFVFLIHDGSYSSNEIRKTQDEHLIIVSVKFC